MGSPFQDINRVVQLAVSTSKEYVKESDDMPDEDWFEETFEVYDIPDELKEFFLNIVHEVVTAYHLYDED
jgi:hypothetical protein